MSAPSIAEAAGSRGMAAPPPPMPAMRLPIAEPPRLPAQQVRQPVTTEQKVRPNLSASPVPTKTPDFNPLVIRREA